MSWNTRATYATSDPPVVLADQLQAIASDIRTWGGPVDAGTNPLVNLSKVKVGTGAATASVDVSPTPASLTQGIKVSQTLHGTGQCRANEIYIPSDDNDNGGVTGSVSQALRITHYFGGSALTGGRASLDIESVLTAPSNASNTTRDYIGARFTAGANTGDGGTGVTLGTAKGAVWAGNDMAVLQSGATNMLGVIGREINWGIATGGSAAISTGLSLVPWASSSVHGAVVDAAINFGGIPGAVSPNYILLLTDAHGGSPVNSNTTIIGTDGASHTILHGIKLSSYTITGNFLESTGFVVDGSGNMATNGAVTFSGLPSSNPGAGSKRLWYDPADGNRVKFAA